VMISRGVPYVNDAGLRPQPEYELMISRTGNFGVRRRIGMIRSAPSASARITSSQTSTAMPDSPGLLI